MQPEQVLQVSLDQSLEVFTQVSLIVYVWGENKKYLLGMLPRDKIY